MASPPRAQVVTWVSIMFILFRETNFCYPKTSAAKQKKKRRNSPERDVIPPAARACVAAMVAGVGAA